MGWFGPSGDCGCCGGGDPCTEPTGCECATGIGTRSTSGTATVVVTGSAISRASTISGCTSPTLCQSLAGTYYQACGACTRYELQEYVCFDAGGFPGFQYIYYWQSLDISHADTTTVTLIVRAGYRQLGTALLGYGVTSMACGVVSGFQRHVRTIVYTAPSIEYCTDQFGDYACTGSFSLSSDTTSTSIANDQCEPNYSYSVSR